MLGGVLQSSAGGGSTMARLITLIALLLAPFGTSLAAAEDVSWNRYGSSTSGFSLQYPAFWEPVAEPPQGVAFQAADPRSVGRGNCSVSVSRMEAIGLVTPEVVLAEMNGRMLLSSFRSALPDAVLIDSGRARLGSATAFSAVIQGTRAGGEGPQAYRMMFVLSYQGQRKYTLLCTALADAYPDAEPVFVRVRDSFRFGGRSAQPPGADLATYVGGVGLRLAAVAGLPDLTFTVTRNPTPDIEVLMGPRIAVSRGLLDALQSEAELAAVLANQTAHLALGDRGGPYGVEDEIKADSLALGYMAQNDYDVAAAIDLQQRFLKYRDENRPGWASGLLAGHPPSTERLAALEDAARRVRSGGIQGREFYQKMIQAAAGSPAL
jgi:Peptidase family M48